MSSVPNGVFRIGNAIKMPIPEESSKKLLVLFLSKTLMLQLVNEKDCSSEREDFLFTSKLYFIRHPHTRSAASILLRLMKVEVLELPPDYALLVLSIGSKGL